MELFFNAFDFIMHFDRYLTNMIQSYGAWTYVLLFLIVYCETGLVVTPFLPGDSLLFVAGALAATGSIDFIMLYFLLMAAAIMGNIQNYCIGRLLGNKAIALHKSRLINKDYLKRTQVFYEKHGRKTIIISRFLPIIRTFAPFVAGIGKMNYFRFMVCNFIGGVLWVSSFLSAGYLFGNIPGVKENFTFVIIGIIVVSLIPSFVIYCRNKLVKAKAADQKI